MHTHTDTRTRTHIDTCLYILVCSPRKDDRGTCSSEGGDAQSFYIDWFMLLVEKSAGFASQCNMQNLLVDWIFKTA